MADRSRKRAFMSSMDPARKVSDSPKQACLSRLSCSSIVLCQLLQQIAFFWEQAATRSALPFRRAVCSRSDLGRGK